MIASEQMAYGLVKVLCNLKCFSSNVPYYEKQPFQPPSLSFFGRIRGPWRHGFLWAFSAHGERSPATIRLSRARRHVRRLPRRFLGASSCDDALRRHPAGKSESFPGAGLAWMRDLVSFRASIPVRRFSERNGVVR